MYTPESHDQMYEILSALRAYAGTNGMTCLAEMLDDALFDLTKEGKKSLAAAAAGKVRPDA